MELHSHLLCELFDGILDGGGWDHVLIFAGYNSGGGRMWVHCTAGSGVVLDTPGYEGSLVLRRLTGVDCKR